MQYTDETSMNTPHTINLTLHGQARTFMPIREYCLFHDLPAEFGVSTFEPKDYTGLASIEQAGSALNQVRDAVIGWCDSRRGMTLRAPTALLDVLMQLTEFFRQQLYAINDQVQLKDAEIEYAVSGFTDVNQRLGYAMIQAHTARTVLPEFAVIYRSWLDDTVRLSSTVHRYEHRGEAWQVQIINHAYGRMGLLVQRGDELDYVYDSALACPAEGYMMRLLADVAAHLFPTPSAL